MYYYDNLLFYITFETYFSLIFQLNSICSINIFVHFLNNLINSQIIIYSPTILCYTI